MSPHRILVVDDDPGQRHVLSRLLAARGFRPLIASSAPEALQKIAAPPGLPHLILLDVSMPGMDGITLMKALRAQPRTALIPMILMSGLVVPSALMEAAAASLGAGPVFFKGDDHDALIARIARALGSAARAGGTRSAVEIDPVKRSLRIGERRIPTLPPQRFQMLCALARAERALSREELLALVWDESDNLNLVDVTVARLRRDLSPFRELSIETAAGGYLLIVGSRGRRPAPRRPRN